RKSDGTPPASLEAHLAEVYLDHPWYDPEVAARVHVNGEGRVTGFIGVFPGRFELHGRPFRAAIAGTLMAENPDRDPLAGARLLRSVIKGPQDISISETTNLLSQGLWERLGGTVLPLLSMDWLRIMRPASAALALLAERNGRAAIFAPAARLGDMIGRRWSRGLEPPTPSARLTRHEDPSDADMASAVCALADLVELHPAWSGAGDIGWFLAQAERKERYGSLRRAVLTNGKGDPVGCYIYHGKPGGAGRALQVLARPDAVDEVVDHMFHDAARTGLAALRGRSTPQLANALLKRNCIFMHRASTVIHTANKELASAAERGEALITGLAGESWTRLIGGAFA
ncbi:MAG: hypothetical protein ACRED5_05415, partial [Propylenella sp.]